MHIMEGFLPVEHAIGWTLASAPLLAWGLYSIKARLREHPEQRMMLSMAAAFAFVLSALKLPSLTGSSSHPTGLGLGSLLFGPLAMVPIGTVVLLFQALLLAHGGLTTLGANVFSMAVVGPMAGYGVFVLARRLRLPIRIGVFMAAFLANLMTYVTTSFQLALAFPDSATGLGGALVKFLGIFAVTQIPLAICEGLVTVMIFNALARFNAHELQLLKLLPAGQEGRA